MSIRKLPELQLPRVGNEVSFEIPRKAMANWDRGVTALASDATITIFDLIGAWYDTGFTVARMSAALRSIGDKPVTVQINSPGGIYDDGVAIYNLLRAHPAQVTTQIVGMAASAASIIVMAGDVIQVGKASHMMIHNTQWLAVGDRNAMFQAFEAMTIFDQTAAKLYADRTGLSVAEIQAMMDKETYLSGPDATAMGFADGLLPSDPVRNEAARSDKPLAYQVEQALHEQGWSRSKSRLALKELRDTPRAASNAKPSAGDDDEADDGLASLRLAAARMSLLRA
jgi:ATP-dependent Clp protease protease subunit